MPEKVGPRLMLGLYLLFFSVYFATGSGHFYRTDEVTVYLTAQSMVEHRNLAIAPILTTVEGKHGKFYAPYGPGQPLLSTPLYLAGRSVEAVGPAPVDRYFRGPNIGIWGSGTVTIFFVSLFNQFVAPLVCLVFLLFCLRLGFSLRASLLTTLVFGFGTAVWMGAHEYFQHPLETLLLLSSVYVLFAHRERLGARQAALAGALFALGVLARANLLLLAPVLLIYALYSASRWAGETGVSRLAEAIARALRALPRARLPAGAIDRALWFTLPVALAVALIMGVNELTFGVFALRPHATGSDFSLTVLPTALYANLFSPGRSLFLYSPPLLLGVALFPALYRRYRAEALLFLAIAVLHLVLYSSYKGWYGGWTWGPRYLLPVVPFLLLPLAYAFEHGRGRRWRRPRPCWRCWGRGCRCWVSW